MSVWAEYESDLAPDMAGPDYDTQTNRLVEPEGSGFALLAGLNLHLGHLTKTIKDEAARRERAARAIPSEYQYAQAALYPSSGILTLDMGAPAVGTWWQVRLIIVGGSDITGTPAGTAWVFVQGQPPNANASLAGVRDFTSGTLPQKATYGTHLLVVHPGEHLWILISGGTNGTQYVATMKAQAYDISVPLEPASEQ